MKYVGANRDQGQLGTEMGIMWSREAIHVWNFHVEKKKRSKKENCYVSFCANLIFITIAMYTHL